MENCPDGCPCPNWDCDVSVPSVVSYYKIFVRTCTYLYLLVYKVVRGLQTFFSVMILIITMTGIDAKTGLPLSLVIVLILVLEIHHVSLRVEKNTKKVSRTVHVWKAALMAVHVTTGIAMRLQPLPPRRPLQLLQPLQPPRRPRRPLQPRPLQPRLQPLQQLPQPRQLPLQQQRQQIQ